MSQTLFCCPGQGYELWAAPHVDPVPCLGMKSELGRGSVPGGLVSGRKEEAQMSDDSQTTHMVESE